MTVLTLIRQPQAPLEAETITPDNFVGKSGRDICDLQLLHGNERINLGEFFRVEGDGSLDVVLNGDLSRVKYVGARMSRGRITVNGNVGMHLGAGISGGVIEVHGSVGDWAGAEMTGGKIHVRGNAGHGLGGAYRGSRHGMNRGLIIVEGNAGNEVGGLMRRGLIVVKGDVGDFAGVFMIAGSILVFGSLGIRAGAGLLRGTLITLKTAELLPTFRYSCTYQPGFMRLICRDLRAEGVEIPDFIETGFYRRYSGDCNRLGKGEILIYDQR